MQFDPENKVIKLCAEGMNVEGEPEKARALFQQAWDIATNDFEAFTAAHYLARHQNTAEEELQWNLEALSRANKVNNEGLKPYYPSLYLNVGKSYENMGNLTDASKYYQLGADSCTFLGDDGYAKMIRGGVAEGLKRTTILPA